MQLIHIMKIVKKFCELAYIVQISLYGAGKNSCRLGAFGLLYLSNNFHQNQVLVIAESYSKQPFLVLTSGKQLTGPRNRDNLLCPLSKQHMSRALYLW